MMQTLKVAALSSLFTLAILAVAAFTAVQGNPQIAAGWKDAGAILHTLTTADSVAIGGTDSTGRFYVYGSGGVILRMMDGKLTVDTNGLLTAARLDLSGTGALISFGGVSGSPTDCTNDNNRTKTWVDTADAYHLKGCVGTTVCATTGRFDYFAGACE